jgi:transcriptional regulator with XRE-family HTH domain/tetratricopeptide (TPR) repeat protein
MKKGRSLDSRIEAASGHPGSLGALLRRHRVDRLLSLEDLAELSGVSDRALSDIERGVSVTPRRRTLLSLIGALGLGEEEAAALLVAARSRKDAANSPSRTALLEPRRLQDFTGRTTELADILRSFTSGPEGSSRAASAVVIYGAPGMGKTTTAIEALNQWRGDRPAELFVDLDGLGVSPLTPLQVLQVLLKQVLGDSRKIPTELGAAAALWLEVSVGSPAGVLLDNAANEAQVRPVLAGNRQGAVVVTSRRSLAGLEDVRRHQLGALVPADSIQLLRHITSPAQHEEAALAHLAELCSHIPLALRIAGNRIASQPSWTVPDFLSRLAREERRLRTLVAGDLAVEAAFNLSHQHLTTENRVLFRRLSLLHGETFSAVLAAAAADQDMELVEDELDELVDLGLVQAVSGNRFKLHDLIRVYADQCLRREESAEEALRLTANLRSWLLSATINAGNWFEPDPAPSPPMVGAPLVFEDANKARQWLYTECSHWFSAYQSSVLHQEHRLVVQVAESLHWFSDLWLGWGKWHVLYGHSADSARILGENSLVATHLNYLAWAQRMEFGEHLEMTLVTASAARETADLAQDDDQRGWAETNLSVAHRLLGHLTEALRAAERSADAFKAAGNEEGQAQALIAQISTLNQQERYKEAGTRIQYLLKALQAGSIPPTIASFTESTALIILARVNFSLGEPHEAFNAATRALHAAERIDHRYAIAQARHLRGRAFSLEAKDAEAQGEYAEALKHADFSGHRELALTFRDLLNGEQPA